MILYGPPASGKDTVTQALSELDRRFEMFVRLKCGPGRTAGYRMTTPEKLAELRARREIVWENERYGATYAIDGPALRAALYSGVPVLHVGQVEAIAAVGAATKHAYWRIVELWAPRNITEDRLRRRNPYDVEQRLAIWEETPRLPMAELQLNTGTVTARSAAYAIATAPWRRQ